MLEGKALETKVTQILNELFPKQWPFRNSPESIILQRISGAMTNVIYKVSTRPNRIGDQQHILLRVYGMGADQFVKRDKELLTTCRLSSMNVCPTLLGVFANGRFEQFMDATTLGKQDLRQPETSRKIATELAKIHKLIDTIDASEKTDPELWQTIEKWLSLAQQSFYPFDDKVDVNVKELEEELVFLKELVSKTPSALVFAHNDVSRDVLMTVSYNMEIL